MMTERQYSDRFKVCREDLDRLIGTAQSRGGTYADLYFQNSDKFGLTLRDGKVSSGGYGTDLGVGIRVLCGEKTGYAYAESTEFPEMMAAARFAAVIGTGGGTGSRTACPARQTSVCQPRQASVCPASPHPVRDNFADWNSVPVDRLVKLMYFVHDGIMAGDSRCAKVTVSLFWTVKYIMMYNSFRELVCDFRQMCSLNATAVFEKDGRKEMKNASRSFRLGPEMLFTADGKPSDSVREVISEACCGIDEAFEAARPKGGEMPVVMGSGASGILLHEAMGHSFEADFNRKGQSIFSGRIGERVCAEGITIVDDGTLHGNRGSCDWDDEGVPGQKTVMVRDGILESYLHDRISAAHYGVAPTGNGRRESFRFSPLPRMRTTYMESGSHSPEEIVASVRKGIYVNEFSNGQVDIGGGDFTFYVRSGRLIEDGRLTAPVKDINISGNGPRALAGITMVGNDLKIDNGSWACGKGQEVPVGVGIPTVLIGKLTVGGE